MARTPHMHPTITARTSHSTSLPSYVLPPNITPLHPQPPNYTPRPPLPPTATEKHDLIESGLQDGKSFS